MLIELLSGIVILLFIFTLTFYYLYTRQRQYLEQLHSDYRSMYVKHGKNWEHFAPFMNDFPGNKENFRFLGTPIDGVIFDDNQITFVEIKTGTSRLSEKQEKVKKLVEEKKVRWKELRY
ncbi:MAG: Holliday junction resolvase-like protein [Nanoarchaeota archaeon]|nr:Holliday junction resolvase-like protein [Nanoarchaeota archaeon]